MINDYVEEYLIGPKNEKLLDPKDNIFLHLRHQSFLCFISCMPLYDDFKRTQKQQKLKNTQVSSKRLEHHTMKHVKRLIPFNFI